MRQGPITAPVPAAGTYTETRLKMLIFFSFIGKAISIAFACNTLKPLNIARSAFYRQLPIYAVLSFSLPNLEIAFKV